MTKEDAIKYLKQLYPNGGHCWLDEQRIEAIGMAVNALQEEPVSEELEKVVEEIVDPTVLNAYGVKEIANRLRRTMIEPVSEGLEQAIDTYLVTYFGGEKEKQEWPFLKKMAIHFAQWQKAQMMKDATEVTVHIDAGGYPYIPQIELYDYDKDIPLAKEGDKYKVVLIKED